MSLNNATFDSYVWMGEKEERGIDGIFDELIFVLVATGAESWDELNNDCCVQFFNACTCAEWLCACARYCHRNRRPCRSTVDERAPTAPLSLAPTEPHRMRCTHETNPLLIQRNITLIALQQRTREGCDIFSVHVDTCVCVCVAANRKGMMAIDDTAYQGLHACVCAAPSEGFISNFVEQFILFHSGFLFNARRCRQNGKWSNFMTNMVCTNVVIKMY